MAKGIINQLSKISLGVVLVLAWGWMYLRADQLFTTNASAMKDIILTYLVFTAVIFSFDALASRRTERPIFRIAFLKAAPKFLISAAITLAGLLIFQSLFKNSITPVIFIKVSTLGSGVILLHALFVSTIEEKVFRAWLVNELRAAGQVKAIAWVLSAIVFAFFHYLLNGEWLTILIYIPLGLGFQWIREKWSPETDMANSGAHFAWNIWILGFLNAI